MFGKEKKSETRNNFSDNNPISSILGKDMKITGDLLFSGKARIDGRVVGDVRGDCLVMSESSKINGNIEVEVLICQGKVEGDLKVQNLLVKSGGVINGSITVVDLLVESGGIINGEVSVPTPELHVVDVKPKTESLPVQQEARA